jgi:predicted RNA-binding protein
MMELNIWIMYLFRPATAPTISECQEGDYEYQRTKSLFVWTIPVVDESNRAASLEFSTPNGQENHFFPVQVRFTSKQLFCHIKVSLFIV